MLFFALSTIWHCFTWPNPMGALQWNFSIRPQVNFKPQMVLISVYYIEINFIGTLLTNRLRKFDFKSEFYLYIFRCILQYLVAKSHSAPQMSSTPCSDQMKITRSQSETTQCKMSGKVDLGVDVRLKNIILDPILTVYEAVINFLSLASEFATSMLW